MKYLTSSLLLLAAFTAIAGGKKRKCPGPFKIKVGDNFYDIGARTAYKCECRDGTGKKDSLGIESPCVPTLYRRNYNITPENPAEWLVVEKPEEIDYIP